MSQFSKLQREVTKESKKTIVIVSIFEEALFGAFPLGIALLFHFPIFFTLIIARMLWAAAHFNSQPMWFALFPIGILYAVFWSVYPLFIIPLFWHPFSNLLTQRRIRKKLRAEAFYRQNVI